MIKRVLLSNLTVVKHNQVTNKEKKPNRFTHNLQKQKMYMLDEGHSVESTSLSYYLCYSNSFLEMLPCLICKTIIYLLRTLWGISYSILITRTYMRTMIILATISNKNKTSIITLINESMNLDVLIKQTMKNLCKCYIITNHTKKSCNLNF